MLDRCVSNRHVYDFHKLPAETIVPFAQRSIRTHGRHSKCTEKYHGCK